MQFREALAQLMALQHQVAVVDHLLTALEDLLPDDTGESGPALLAPNALPERVPDAVIEAFVEELTKKRDALVAELVVIQSLETKNGSRKRT